MTHVIFDLDGTLIDSAPSILQGFEVAFQQTGLPLQQPLNSAVIGPPLMETLRRLSGRDDPACLQALAAAFKQHYDSVGYQATQVFAGVNAMLASLHAAGTPLYIATNKRHVPTLKIVDYLGWQAYFRAVVALDAFNPPCATKADMIARLLADHGLAPQQCLYVGDRLEDGQAASAQPMPFVLASWGYAGDLAACPPEWPVCQSVAALPAMIAALRPHASI